MALIDGAKQRYESGKLAEWRKLVKGFQLVFVSSKPALRCLIGIMSGPLAGTPNRLNDNFGAGRVAVLPRNRSDLQRESIY